MDEFPPLPQVTPRKECNGSPPPSVPTPPKTPSPDSDDPPKLDGRRYVQMPFQVGKNSYVYLLENGRKRKIQRWEVIKEELVELKRVCNEEIDRSVGDAIREAIEAYNRDLRCSFVVLEEMVEAAAGIWGDREVREVVGFVVDVCVGGEGMFPRGVRCLRGEAFGVEEVEFGKWEVLCIVCYGFFCCYPGRGGGGERDKYPRINFDSLFDDKDQGQGGRSSWRSGMKEAKVNKLLCIFNYFRRMKERFRSDIRDCGSVAFERRRLDPKMVPRWGSLDEGFCRLEVFEEGSIDDSCDGLRVDFANKMVGGGTIGNGAAMEEIMFSCCSELIASQLFTRELRDNEVLIVRDFERFSEGKGYSGGFRWAGDHVEEGMGRGNRVAVIDAVRFERDSLMTQLEKKWIDRELMKCYVAFQGEKSKIVSGKWGCGVFNGDPVLKCVIQWIACSVAGVELIEIYTFGDSVLGGMLSELLGVFRNVSVGRVYNCLVEFGVACKKRGWSVSGGELFEFMVKGLVPGDVVVRGLEGEKSLRHRVEDGEGEKSLRHRVEDGEGEKSLRHRVEDGEGEKSLRHRVDDGEGDKASRFWRFLAFCRRTALWVLRNLLKERRALFRIMMWIGICLFSVRYSRGFAYRWGGGFRALEGSVMRVVRGGATA